MTTVAARCTVRQRPGLVLGGAGAVPMFNAASTWKGYCRLRSRRYAREDCHDHVDRISRGTDMSGVPCLAKWPFELLKTQCKRKTFPTRSRRRRRTKAMILMLFDKLFFRSS
jgi:hypothetical protein